MPASNKNAYSEHVSLSPKARTGRSGCEPVDLAAIAADVLGAHDLSEFDGVVALKPASTTGDPDLLERLAANLVSNAIRHNIAGGRIDVATRTESGRAHLTVANTGPLIPAGKAACLPPNGVGPAGGSDRSESGWKCGRHGRPERGGRLGGPTVFDSTIPTSGSTPARSSGTRWPLPRPIPARRAMCS